MLLVLQEATFATRKGSIFPKSYRFRGVWVQAGRCDKVHLRLTSASASKLTRRSQHAGSQTVYNFFERMILATDCWRMAKTPVFVCSVLFFFSFLLFSVFVDTVFLLWLS